MLLLLHAPLLVLLPVLSTLRPLPAHKLLLAQLPGLSCHLSRQSPQDNGGADSGARRGPWESPPPARPGRYAGASRAKRNWAGVAAGRSEVRPESFLIPYVSAAGQRQKGDRASLLSWRAAGAGVPHSHLEGIMCCI